MLIVPISIDVHCGPESILNKRKLEVAYKQIFRSFHQCKREGITNQMIQLNVDPNDVIVRELGFGFGV